MPHVYSDPATAARFSLARDASPGKLRATERLSTPLFTIAWNRGATQQLTVDELPIAVPANGFVALMTNQRYSFSRTTDVVLWQFNREFYCIVDHDDEVSCAGLLFYGAQGNAVLQPDANELRRLLVLLDVFEDEFSQRDTIQGEMLRALLKRLIIILTRRARLSLIGDALTTPQVDTVRQFNILVEQHFRRLHRVSDYAALLHKAPKTLANLFAAHGQQSPLQVIQARVALEGRRLLLYTDKSVKQIASELGFADSATFSRFFKGAVGQRPQEFRSARGGLPVPG